MLATSLFTACTSRPGLVVFAAASLTDAFNELGDSLRRRDPGLRIQFNFAGSQTLAFQIEQGAAADVFASADERWMAIVRDSGYVADTPSTLVRNRLVVIVPERNRAHVENLEDLARQGIRLVLAADQVPAGRYARQVLLNLSHKDGFGPDFAPRVLANVVSNESNVRSVATKVQLGEADAGIVYVSDVTPAIAARVRRIDIPDAENVIAPYPIALLRRAPHLEAGRAFIASALAPEGQRVLERNGFLPRD
ncbi:MAG TPA: molybdate ABC transporter substrate-binding protein [Gemmatimonadales bacterium]|nr:molybdate ABC transporter substrate-binding protein [Gemmatimonadales bacterium]